jgi:hydroxymethylpyrimidine pyrophosphatase-like HAD family hydrolase
MRYRALATDYDGTLAFDGLVDEPTVEALRRARGAGLRTILVTGRELSSLFNRFSGADLFDRIVAENGAVLYDPGTGSVDRLAPPPPPMLLEALQRAGVPFSVGHSIVATCTPHDEVLQALIRRLELDWHLTFNKGAVMALPAEVTKATGLSFALSALEVGAPDTAGIGDAENDHAFLRLCGLAVAVDNALPGVKVLAHVVTAGARGAGVRELIERLLSGEFDRVDAPQGRLTSAPAHDQGR